nr:PREDICTED: protein toll-like isoform X1 [Linepithema humile]XP_012217886.1 PREDICTED: protein toll-like isoform X1 [Linepithema humile]
MSTCHKTCIIIHFIAMISIFAFQCPTNKECRCRNWDHLTFFYMNCTINNNNSVLEILYTNLAFNVLNITCVNSADLSNFNLNIWNITLHNTSWASDYLMVFKECNLSKNIKLINIAQMLNDTDLELIFFASQKNLNLTLEKHHLNGLQNLKKLFIYNYNIHHVNKDLLANLQKLQILHITNTNLESLAVEFFDFTPELNWLYLRNNSLRRIESTTFDKLTNLIHLDLRKNYLTEFPAGIFDKLVALRHLDVSMNDLSSLPENIFAKLENLNNLFLEGNNFTNLPKDLLQNNTKLARVYLNDNQRNLTLLDEFFSNLTKVKHLELMNNGLITLPKDLFWGSSSLEEIVLSNNYLQSLPVEIFRDLSYLEILELDSNYLEALPDNIFKNTKKLKKLNLSNNRITTISKNLFDNLFQLEQLNMERNHLRTISDYNFYDLRNLKIVNLSHNYLTLSKWSHAFDIWIDNDIEKLYLVNNSISEILYDWIKMKKLQTLDLSYNNISTIKTEDLLFSSHNVLVNLTHNKIQNILLHDAEDITKIRTKTDRSIRVLVENNPLNCDCDVYDFLRYYEEEMSNVRRYFQIELHDLTCHSPKELKKVRLYSRNLTCEVQNTDSICPEKCDCFLKPHDKAFIFDCSHKNLTNVPNNIREPDIHFIQNLTKSVKTITKFYLNFSHNRLTQMPDLEKLKLRSVNKLFLSHNDISTISKIGLSETTEDLELHNNNLLRIDLDVLRFWNHSANLTHLTLHENPWECDCDARNFYKFIHSESGIIKMPEAYKVICHRKNTSISEMTWDDFCPSHVTMIISISATIAFIGLIGSIFGLYYKYQEHIKIWLFAHQWCLWFVTEEELDKDRLYDAFVSFSHKDIDFIADELIPNLESGPTPFKLCVHYRDWLAGEWIPDNIARSVDNSRRTIVVLSPNFLKSIWGRMEFRAAHRQALSEKRTRVILILYGDIGPTDNLDPELRAYISMNTYVKWGDPWFWDKLRYALPHQSRRPRSNYVQREVLESEV